MRFSLIRQRFYSVYIILTLPYTGPLLAARKKRPGTWCPVLWIDQQLQLRCFPVRKRLHNYFFLESR